ncbi:hypothetical protein J1605_012794 [Eschrichtius robustus]|uniref:Uncharacterized protein n=1 Tax=Eschrichtius robustus TaxID=9764 RepID=A0AB34GJX0_ESCRO|nr:hypothetical protein J1605_012794 [Eschrichtius robustus]
MLGPRLRRRHRTQFAVTAAKQTYTLLSLVFHLNQGDRDTQVHGSFLKHVMLSSCCQAFGLTSPQTLQSRACLRTQSEGALIRACVTSRVTDGGREAEVEGVVAQTLAMELLLLRRLRRS